MTTVLYPMIHHVCIMSGMDSSCEKYLFVVEASQDSHCTFNESFDMKGELSITEDYPWTSSPSRR